MPTLSGGEAQRIRLAAQLGSNLSGVLYVLDEPTIGLHARDNERLLDTLHRLRDRGNSLVVVEHDEETMRRSDFIIDLGPGAGVKGGEVVAAGTLGQLRANPNSLTGRALAQTPSFPTLGRRRPVGARQGHGWIELSQASLHNLKNVSVRIPAGRFTVVTGVSGSGKSTLVKDCLAPSLAAVLSGKSAPGGRLGRLGDRPPVRALHEVSQDPIGRTPRSTPATYVGFFDEIRALFASSLEAKMRGYGPGRFSFNAAAGRCPDCEGAGFRTLEMNFLPSAQVRCDRCGGRRFNPETLDIVWNGKNIAQVLDMDVAEAREFFAAHRKIRRALDALHDTGLDYLKLGQTSPTLSGGEAQRIKLVAHLLGGLRPDPATEGIKAGKPSPRDMFILEEPTVGLHFEDVRRLVAVLQRLADAGHTVLVIEHHLELIAEADWVVDLGPEGGEGGGRVVAEGAPERIAAHPASITGRHLRPLLRSPASPAA
jgi:excinuclease ABC subunit A